MDSEENSCVLSCVAKRNINFDGTLGTGIHLLNCTDCIVKSNITLGNGERGIEIDEAVFSESVYSNLSTDQTFNFTLVNVPAGTKIPIATFDASLDPLFTLNTTDTISKWHNVESGS